MNELALYGMLHLTCETNFLLYSSCSLSVWCIIITQLFSIFAVVLDIFRGVLTVV